MCASCYGKQLRIEKPEQYLEYDLKRAFGISLDEYNTILGKQNGCCAICGISNNEIANGKETRFSVDHDHKTGEIRGLLCGNCNRGVGNLKDSIETLKSAINYLT